MLRALFVAALTAFTLPAQTEAALDKAKDQKVDLAVLYVGSKEGPRTTDFVQFLGKHFRKVGTAVYPEFEAAEADPFDVVILDVQMKPTKRSIGIGKQPKLPKSYNRATVLVNGPGVIVADHQLNSKINWC